MCAAKENVLVCERSLRAHSSTPADLGARIDDAGHYIVTRRLEGDRGPAASDAMRARCTDLEQQRHAIVQQKRDQRR